MDKSRIIHKSKEGNGLNNTDESEYLESLLRTAENIVPVKNDLLRKEHAAYCLAVYDMIGRQNMVAYNAMGPDISTVLLLTNPGEILGIDSARVDAEIFEEYVTDNWDIIDKKSVIGLKKALYSYSGSVCLSGASEADVRETFLEKQYLRKLRGYWDESDMYAFGVERWLAVELKKLGVQQEDIVIDHADGSPADRDGFSISFDWAYPGEEKKNRKLQYLHASLYDFRDKSSIFRRKKCFGDYADDIDCFYQKSLPDTERTSLYISTILPYMNDRKVIMVGHQFEYGNKNINVEFCEEIKDTLGQNFSKENNVMDPLIDSLSYDEYKLHDNDKEFASYKYGMKLHIFRGR